VDGVTVGYTPKRTVYRLRFDGEYQGLEVRVRSLTLGESMDIQPKINVYRIPVTTEHAAQWQEAVDALVDHLMGWNVQGDDGRPVEPSREAVTDLETALVFTILREWSNAMIGYEPPDAPPAEGGPAPLDMADLDLQAEMLPL
jgi:hypothetical protein